MTCCLKESYAFICILRLNEIKLEKNNKINCQRMSTFASITHYCFIKNVHKFNAKKNMYGHYFVCQILIVTIYVLQMKFSDIDKGY